jgi:hypothetical protein
MLASLQEGGAIEAEAVLGLRIYVHNETICRPPQSRETIPLNYPPMSQFFNAIYAGFLPSSNQRFLPIRAKIWSLAKKSVAHLIYSNYLPNKRFTTNKRAGQMK